MDIPDVMSMLKNAFYGGVAITAFVCFLVAVFVIVVNGARKLRRMFTQWRERDLV